MFTLAWQIQCQFDGPRARMDQLIETERVINPDHHAHNLRHTDHIGLPNAGPRRYPRRHEHHHEADKEHGKHLYDLLRQDCRGSAENLGMGNPMTVPCCSAEQLPVISHFG